MEALSRPDANEIENDRIRKQAADAPAPVAAGAGATASSCRACCAASMGVFKTILCFM